MSTRLFDPIRLGDLELPNRLIMAPLTRCRTGEDRVPTELMAQYYTQRATAGLILTEATAVVPGGVGYPNTPGLWSEEQVQGWKRVTESVHAKGGRIVAQLWHVGRISDPVHLNGELPVAPSAIAATGHPNLIRPIRPFVTPRALELSEIPALIEGYRKGAENAKRAGFDGVEIHGANGYLPDQFLQDGTNHRTDEYGGPIENRARFLLEATDAAITVWGAKRVGVHLAPGGHSYGITDSNPVATFGYVARELGKRGIAFLFAREGLAPEGGRLGPELKKIFQTAGGGGYIANDSLTKDTAAQLLANGEADAVAFGVLFIANPDLVQRFKTDAPLNAPHKETFYIPGPNHPEGYIDYPALTA